MIYIKIPDGKYQRRVAQKPEQQCPQEVLRFHRKNTIYTQFNRSTSRLRFFACDQQLQLAVLLVPVAQRQLPLSLQIQIYGPTYTPILPTLGQKITIMCRRYKLKQARLESHLVYWRQPVRSTTYWQSGIQVPLTLNCSLWGSKRELLSLKAWPTLGLGSCKEQK